MSPRWTSYGETKVDRITIVVHLPAPLGAVGDLLMFVHERWPDAKLDTSHPDGWRIEARWPPT